MKRVLVLLLLVVSSLFAIAAEAEYDYGKVRWRMTIEEVTNALGGKPEVYSRCIKRWNKYCGLDFKETYYFTSSSLDNISFEIDKEALPHLVSDFTRKFGNPYSFKTNMNSFFLEAHFWKNNRTEATVLFFFGVCQVYLQSLKPLPFEKTDSLF